MAKSSRKKPVSPVPARPANTAPPADRKIPAKPGPVPVSAPPAATRPAAPVAPVVVAPVVAPGFQLIRFDTRTRWTIGIIVAVFVLAALLKIHTLSVGMWNQLLPDGSNPRRGVLAGTPQQIRMDEYAVYIPNTLSNVNKGFPIANETLGGENVALLGAPAHHALMIFKPALWAYSILGAEQSMAWQGNFTYFCVLLGSFLFFLLVTRSNYFLSLFGSLWLWLSSGSQNWNGGADTIIGMFALLFVLGIYVLFGRQAWWAKLLLAAGFGWTLFSTALLVYPPFQVPMGYSFLFLFVGYTVQNWKQLPFDRQFLRDVLLAMVAVAVVGAVFWLAYSDLKSTITAMSNTVYPGRRSEAGGTGFIANWFSDYYSWLIGPQKYPKSWLNYCELSHYVNFAPVVMACLAVYFVRNRTIDWSLALLSLWIIALVVWVELGWPKWLAEGTLMSMSPTRRTQIPLGASTVLLTILYLNYLLTNRLAANAMLKTVSVIGAIGFVLYTAWVNLGDADGLFKSYQMFLPVLFFSALNVLLLIDLEIKYRTAFFGAAMLIYLLPNLTFNPLGIGLSPITDHALYKAVREIQAKDPNARWVVFGSQYISYMITATGVNLLSGVKSIPDRAIMKVLDPSAKRDSAYNRYAHTVYQSYIKYPGPMTVNDPVVNRSDSVVIYNNFEDGCLVAMDPCSPKLKKLNVRYVVFDHEPQPLEVRCHKLISTLGTIKIYQRQD